MTDDYRARVLNTILAEIKADPNVLGAWEGGSSANGTSDQYSDIDLCIVVASLAAPTLDQVEKSLAPFEVVHTWQPQKASWGDGLLQRVIVLKDSPKHFSVDVGVIGQAYPQMIQDFLEVERHGQPIIYFDKANVIRPGNTDAEALFQKQTRRLSELNEGFLIFKTLALKEIDRGHAIDAISFYQIGLLRPLVEILGMIYRPYKYDFGMRYLHQSFPTEIQALIEELSYIPSFAELPQRIEKLEAAFQEATRQAGGRRSLLGPSEVGTPS